MEMEGSVTFVLLCYFFAHICSKPCLRLIADRVPRQTETTSKLVVMTSCYDKKAEARRHALRLFDRPQHPFFRPGFPALLAFFFYFTKDLEIGNKI